MKHKWEYDGDMNLEQGGFFWKEDGAEDYVLAVKVTPCSDAGGPDNLFCIESGSIYMPENEASRKSALDCIGAKPESASRRDLVYAFNAYHGIERSSWGGEHYVQIGKHEESRGWSPDPDKVLRAGSSLANYVKNNFL